MFHCIVCMYGVAHLPQRPGYYTREGDFVFVKEMIPEFVVPDLTNFKVCNYQLFVVKPQSVMDQKWLPSQTTPHLFEIKYNPLQNVIITQLKLLHQFCSIHELFSVIMLRTWHYVKWQFSLAYAHFPTLCSVQWHIKQLWFTSCVNDSLTPVCVIVSRR